LAFDQQLRGTCMHDITRLSLDSAQRWLVA